MLVENSPDSHKPVEIDDLRAHGDSRSGKAGKGPERSDEAIRGDPSARKGLFHEARRVG